MGRFGFEGPVGFAAAPAGGAAAAGVEPLPALVGAAVVAAVSGARAGAALPAGAAAFSPAGAGSAAAAVVGGAGSAVGAGALAVSLGPALSAPVAVALVAPAFAPAFSFAFAFAFAFALALPVGAPLGMADVVPVLMPESPTIARTVKNPMSSSTAIAPPTKMPITVRRSRGTEASAGVKASGVESGVASVTAPLPARAASARSESRSYVGVAALVVI